MYIMPEISIKDKLRFAIADINDERLLESIYNILTYAEKRDLDVPDDHLNVLKERESKYLAGEDKGLTTEEFKAKFSKENGV